MPNERRSAASPTPSVVPSTSEPARELEIPEWTPLRMKLSRSHLRRHVLVIGETGSGKTASVLMPLLRAILSSDGRDTDAPSALVIDPKDGELTKFLSTELPPERLKVIAPERGKWMVPFFVPEPSGRVPDPHRLLDELITADYGSAVGGIRNAGFWIASVRQLLGGFIAADHWVARNHRSSQVRLVWEALLQELPHREDIQHTDTPFWDPAVEGLWDRGGYIDILSWAVSRALADRDFLSRWGDVLSRHNCPPKIWRNTASMGGIPHETLGGIIVTAQNLLNPFTLAATNGHLWTSPFHRPPKGLLDPTALMDQGTVTVYRPADPSTRSNVLGRAIKRAFFSAALKSRDRSREFLYLADEFHRFITADPECSEASFFDRCRSYGVSCVVATQSESSLRQALETAPGSQSPESALQVMLSNLANHFYFRTTDVSTQSRLRTLLPQHPTKATLPHVTAVRPITSLATGEAYWLSASGGWGRGHVRLLSTATGRERA